MGYLAILSEELRTAAEIGDVKRCQEITKKINKVMDTYDRSC